MTTHPADMAALVRERHVRLRRSIRIRRIRRIRRAT